MKTEDKDLLIQDLCARLPYGVKCSFGVDDAVYEICGINPMCCGASEIQATHIKSGINGDFVINACKLYLFPLSSMTEEQKEELYIVTNGKFNAGYKYIDNCKPRNWSEWGTTEYNWIRHYDIDLLHTWLNKNHFDYRGLISMGLAIDATGLNIY